MTVPDVEDTRQAAHTFVVELPAYIHEVLSALVPIIPVSYTHLDVYKRQPEVRSLTVRRARPKVGVVIRVKS